jgi:3-oxoacyl-[acyl-carrier protein] reductase
VTVIRRTAIVTGGAGGIGRAEVIALARDAKADVAVLYQTNESGAQAAVRACCEIGGRAMAVRCDVTHQDEVRHAVEQVVATFGRLDILVNNAGAMGASYNKQIIDLDVELWDEMLNSHLTGTFLCIKYCAPHMIQNRWGRIINTSSIHGRTGGRATLSAYGAAKAGIDALTRTAARELGPHRITCNSIAPGFVKTERLASYMSEERLGELSRQIPLGRAAMPEEIAAAVVFIASEQASYLNGTIIDLNGGRAEYC